MKWHGTANATVLTNPAPAQITRPEKISEEMQGVAVRD
jgi:hypothetical protein